MRSGICWRSPRRAPSRLLLEMEIRWRREGRLSSLERPLVDGPGRREAARRYRETHASQHADPCKQPRAARDQRDRMPLGIYHANYLRYMERGRTNHLRLIGANHRALLEGTEKEAPGFAFVVRSMTLDFLRPARVDAVLEIVTEPEVVKGASIILHQRVMRGDQILVEASVRVAFVSGGRARPIPNPLRIAMRADQEARS
jgi:acyl-CoA thioester hydrolase